MRRRLLFLVVILAALALWWGRDEPPTAGSSDAAPPPTPALRNVNYSYPSATTRIPHGVVVVGGQPALEKRGFSVRSVDGGEAFGRLPLAVGVGRTRHGQTTAAASVIG